MRKALLLTMLIASFVAIVTYALQSFAFQPDSQAYGYSSEDFLGGGSYLGVDTRDITSDRLGTLKLKEERGVEVTMVDQDAPAGKAGIKEHDVILTINGNNVESVEELRRMIREIPPGRVISIGISRDGQPLSLKAQLADRKRAFAWSGPQTREFHFEVPAMPIPPDMDLPMAVVMVHSSVRSGLMVENLTPQLGDFFGAKNGHGVLVRSVEKGSNAERAGFHAGDVITKVNSEPVSDASDFSHALRSQKMGGTVNVSIIRDKKEQTLTLTLPERRQSGGLMEESLDDSDTDAETHIDLRAAQAELAQVQPQMALAVRQARQAAEQFRKQMCERQEELRKQQEESQQEQRERQKDLREQQKELRDRLRDQQEEMRDQMLEQERELRDGMGRGRADI